MSSWLKIVRGSTLVGITGTGLKRLERGKRGDSNVRALPPFAMRSTSGRVSRWREDAVGEPCTAARSGLEPTADIASALGDPALGALPACAFMGRLDPIAIPVPVVEGRRKKAGMREAKIEEGKSTNGRAGAWRLTRRGIRWREMRWTL